MIECEVLKSFPYALDGFTTRLAEAGQTIALPLEMAVGLEADGFVRAAAGDAKAVPSAPENKAIDAAPENASGDGLAALRVEYQTKAGKRPFHGWGADDLRAKIEELANGGQ